MRSDDSSEDKHLVETWIKLHQVTPDSDEYDLLFWSFEKFDDVLHSDPDRAWNLVLQLVDASPSDRVLELVAAGPMEDLMDRHGKAVIDRVEGMAKKSPRFKQMLAGVWLDEDPAGVAARFYSCAEVTPFYE